MKKGQTHTLETKAKMSLAQKGRVCSLETREKLSTVRKGRSYAPLSLEHKTKLSIAHKGKHLSSEHKAKLSVIRKGKKFSPEHKANISKAKISASLHGEKAPNWQGGISFKPYCPKFDEDLKRRVRAFFDHQCIFCAKTTIENKQNLSVHHVDYNKDACCDEKPAQFAACCLRCHSKTNSDRERWNKIICIIIDEIYGGKSYFTKEEWATREECYVYAG
jgi:hypothetical protein